jgi:hypothetical protein
MWLIQPWCLNTLNPATSLAGFFMTARQSASCEEALKNSVKKMEKMSRKNAVGGA